MHRWKEWSQNYFPNQQYSTGTAWYTREREQGWNTSRVYRGRRWRIYLCSVFAL